MLTYTTNLSVDRAVYYIVCIHKITAVVVLEVR